MSDLPDLAALREKAEKATTRRWTVTKAEWIAAATPDVILAVLALVDTLQEALRRADRCHDCGGTGVGRCYCDGQTCRPYCQSGKPCSRCDATGLGTIARAALSVSPAEKKQPELDGLEWGWEYEPFEKRLTVRARMRGQSVWRDVFVIDQAELR